jgi:hypothetical protein
VRRAQRLWAPNAVDQTSKHVPLSEDVHEALNVPTRGSTAEISSRPTEGGSLRALLLAIRASDQAVEHQHQLGMNGCHTVSEEVGSNHTARKKPGCLIASWHGAEVAAAQCRPNLCRKPPLENIALGPKHGVMRRGPSECVLCGRVAACCPEPWRAARCLDEVFFLAGLPASAARAVAYATTVTTALLHRCVA